jgi:hypothetical protein
MPDTMPPRLTHIKSRKIRLATGCRCELCHEHHPFSLLEIHHVPQGEEDADDVYSNLQDYILVVCPLCHTHIHEMPVPLSEQQKRVRKRPFVVKELIRDILGYPPKDILPPDTLDPPTF